MKVVLAGGSPCALDALGDLSQGHRVCGTAVDLPGSSVVRTQVNG